MGQILHGSARTTEAVRRAIQHSQESLRALEPGLTRDMRGIGHYGTGDVEVTLSSLDDLRKADPLIQRAYEGG